VTGKLRLGVNIDHVATIRNARGGDHPDPVRAAIMAAEAGADGITAHLREDRRHITDRDIDRLMAEIDLPLNLEMAATEEMLAIALAHKPHAACIVPEKREERTTEGGLDAAGQRAALEPTIRRLQASGIHVSLFIEPDATQIEAARELGAEIIELHTGAFANARDERQDFELHRLKRAAAQAHQLGLQVNAGHGINYTNIALIRTIPHLADLNIGHSIVARALFTGLESAVAEMLRLMSA
jgi:pyridoxine 5-phosphate synthase